MRYMDMDMDAYPGVGTCPGHYGMPSFVHASIGQNRGGAYTRDP